MSLYRQVKRRNWRITAALALICLALGFVVGFLIGKKSGEGQQSLSEAVAQLQQDLAPVLDGLELVTIEYPQSVKDGRIIAATEYKATQENINRTLDQYGKLHPELAAISPSEAASAQSALKDVERLVQDRAPASKVDAAAERAVSSIKRAAFIER